MDVRSSVMVVAAAAVAIAAAADTAPPYATELDITSGHHLLAKLVAAEWPNLEFSSRLSDAARAVAEVSSDGKVPSSADIRKALHNSGLPEGFAVTATVATTEEGPADVLDNLATVLSDARPVTHVGLGRAPASRPPFRWQWTILLIDRRIDLHENIPAAHRPGTAFPVRFSLRPGWQHPRILVQYPDDRTRRMTPAQRGGVWFTVIPVGSESGELVVQILADNDVGPGVAAVMPMRVGKPSPEHEGILDQTSVSADTNITGTAEAALELWNIVNAARVDHGLHRLQWDPELASIALHHSQDMMGAGFFGHRSPTEGDLRRRLANASYIASVSRENLALDQDLGSAHRSLMASPGHRSNVLASDVTNLGIGVVKQESMDGPPMWYITEIFTRKAQSAEN